MNEALKFMKKWQKWAIALVVVFLGFQMCGGGGNSIDDIAGTYKIRCNDGEDNYVKMKVLDDGRVSLTEFNDGSGTGYGKVVEVVNGVFAVELTDGLGGAKIEISKNGGAWTHGGMPAYKTYIFDTNEGLMYWSYDDYNNRDIAGDIWVTRFE